MLGESCAKSWYNTFVVGCRFRRLLEVLAIIGCLNGYTFEARICAGRSIMFEERTTGTKRAGFGHIFALALLLVALVAALPGLAFAKDEHHQSSGSWNEWLDDKTLPTEPGQYFLTKDVTLDATWEVPEGEGPTVICLNGNDVSLAEGKTGNLITVASGRTLTIDNCEGERAFKGKISVETGGTLQAQGKVKVDEVSLSADKDCVITVSGKLETDAQINVTKLDGEGKATTGIITSGFKDSESLGDPSTYFKSKDPAFMVTWDKDNKEAQLSKYLAFDANGEGAEGTMDSKPLGDSTLDLPKCTYTLKGFVFVDWNTAEDGSGTSYTDEQQGVSFTETTTLYAQWGHTVSFDKNADDATGEAMKDQIVRVGKELALENNTYIRKGWKFSGWTANKDGSGEIIPDGDSRTFDANTTLYAQWEKETVTVTFDKNDKKAKGTMDPQQAKWGEQFTLKENEFKLSGYTFDSWNTEPDGSGKKVSNKAKVTLRANMTFYAQWAENYTISFNKNADDATGTMKAQTATEGKALTLNKNAFTLTGYSFKEWNTKKDGSGKAYSDGAKAKFTADTELFAQWTKNTDPDSLMVTFDKNADDATGSMAPQTAKKGEAFALNANSFTRSGYTFVAWNTKADGSGIRVPNNAKVKLNSNVTLYAQWSKNGSQGGIEVFIDVQSGAPQVTSSNLRQVAEAIFSTSEVNQGAKLTLTASPRAQTALSDSDKNALNDFISRYKLTNGVVFDLSLSKQVGGGAVTSVSTTPQKVALNVQVPSSLQTTSTTNKRTFYLLRIHEGQVSALAGTTSATLTGQTDQFSTYAIAYRDTTQQNNNNSSNRGGTTNRTSTGTSTTSSSKTKQATAKTGDSSMTGIAIAAIAVVGVGVLAFGVVSKRKRKS